MVDGCCCGSDRAWLLFEETPEAKRAARAFLQGAHKRGEMRAAAGLEILTTAFELALLCRDVWGSLDTSRIGTWKYRGATSSGLDGTGPKHWRRLALARCDQSMTRCCSCWASLGIHFLALEPMSSGCPLWIIRLISALN